MGHSQSRRRDHERDRHATSAARDSSQQSSSARQGIARHLAVRRSSIRGAGAAAAAQDRRARSNTTSSSRSGGVAELWINTRFSNVSTLPPVPSSQQGGPEMIAALQAMLAIESEMTDHSDNSVNGNSAVEGSCNIPQGIVDDPSAAPDAICRFCLEPRKPNDALISPCGCSGTGRFIHYLCLQRWRSQVMLSMSGGNSELGSMANTSPDRAHRCAVCAQQYGVAAPERPLLMSHLRQGGARIASMLRPGCLLVAVDRPDPDLQGMHMILRLMLERRLRFWRRSIILLASLIPNGSNQATGEDALVGLVLTCPEPLPSMCLEATLGVNSAEANSLLASSANFGVEAGGPCNVRDTLIVHNVPNASVQGFAIQCPHAGADDTDDDTGAGGAAQDNGDIAQGADVLYVVPGSAVNLKAVWTALQIAQQQGFGTALFARVFAGHAKWGVTQLQNEVMRGDWGVCQATTAMVAAACTERVDAWQAIVGCPLTKFAEALPTVE